MSLDEGSYRALVDHLATSYPEVCAATVKRLCEAAEWVEYRDGLSPHACVINELKRTEYGSPW